MDVWIGDVRFTMIDNDTDYVYSVKKKGNWWTVSRKPVDKAETMATLEILTSNCQWRPLTCPSSSRPLKDDSLGGMIFFLTGRTIENFIWD